VDSYSLEEVEPRLDGPELVESGEEDKRGSESGVLGGLKIALRFGVRGSPHTLTSDSISGDDICR